jgi:fructokinase
MDIVCIGVAIMDMFPSEYGKHLTDVPYFIPAPGGAPANVAVAAARLGLKSAFIGKVGEDIFGHHLAKVFESHGVNILGMHFDKTACTTMNIHAKPDEKTTEYLFYRKPGADTLLRPDELDRDLLRMCKILHFDSLNLTHEPIRDATMEAIRIVKDNGGTISFDVNYREPVWENKQEAIDSILKIIPRVDIVKLNDDELLLLTGSCNPEIAVKPLLALGPHILLLTMGSKGSWVFTKNEGIFVEAFNVNAIDTIGCGDAFVAGFLTYYIKEKAHGDIIPVKLREFLIYANAVGALTASKKGVIPALPDKQEVAEFLREFKVK